MQYNRNVFVGFSLYTWKLDRHLPTSALSVPDDLLAQLMDETGISGYTNKPMCDATMDIYSVAVNGWKNGTNVF